MLPASVALFWIVVVDGRIVARFHEERDARGFARARYGHEAEVLGASTQEALVLEGLRRGCETTREIVALTGLPMKHVSAHLQRLRRRGVVQQSGESYHSGVSGQPGYRYVLTWPDAGALDAPQM